jgi:hypothetical protein
MTDRTTPAPDEPGPDVDQTASDPDRVSDGDQDERLPPTRWARRWPSALDLERAFD